MAFRVHLTDEAERDLEDIYRFVAENDSVVRADRLLAALEDTCRSLAVAPERGNVPKELRELGISEFRESHYKPYRIVYRILGRRVFVYGVFDGRRDMQSLLQRRLLR